MKKSAYILTFLLAAASYASCDETPPIAFAQSGQEVTLPARWLQGKSVDAAALWVFGQRWGNPVAARYGSLKISAPTVRVPVVFRLVSETKDSPFLGEVVVYPEQTALWGQKEAILAAWHAPEWFNAWSAALNIPIRNVEKLESLWAGDWRTPDRSALLIIGGASVKGGAEAVLQIAAKYELNVLVLESDDWRAGNETVVRNVAISPGQMIGPLADLQQQTWQSPPMFLRRELRVFNRETFIAGPEHPLVEEIRGPQPGAEPYRVVFSYLPWPEQLGRCEVADQLFVRLLKATAAGAKNRPPLDARWRLLYPSPKEIDLADRPVLAAAIKSLDGDSKAVVGAFVIDLRGKLPDKFDLDAAIENRATIEAAIGDNSHLLIVGDHRSLDDWQWLMLDRQRRRSLRPGILWLPDAALPDSAQMQLLTMEFFTKSNVLLGN